MIDRDIANLELRIRHAVGLVVWPVVGGVFGALIGVIFGFVVGGAVPLSLGVAIGAGFVALGTVAGGAFCIWAEIRTIRSRSRGHRAA
ncbi:putative membrane protein [Actinomadura luteofluorescens]|uniref:Putative membrane protein n=1 Tax=Actinomadura luteofluorescens TaxID=46163 RepID=A0A7Y9JJV2_9ACTN|nr:hypothetical protein [Actinomadura luteofluorescens]NYD49809.1 putative membrane protein [Actinomadura luteofluorescens]